VKVQLTKLEKKAAKIIATPTEKVYLNGYREYRKFIDEVPKEEKEKYPFERKNIASTSELQSLINGKRSILDIKNNLDVQYARKSKLQSILNYIKVLELAGLVEVNHEI